MDSLAGGCHGIFLNEADRQHFIQALAVSRVGVKPYLGSFFAIYVAAPEHRPRWIRVERLLGEHGLQEDSAACREQFEPWMEGRRTEEGDPEGFAEAAQRWIL